MGTVTLFARKVLERVAGAVIAMKFVLDVRGVECRRIFVDQFGRGVLVVVAPEPGDFAVDVGGLLDRWPIAPTLAPAKPLNQQTKSPATTASKAKTQAPDVKANPPANPVIQAKRRKWVANYVYDDGNGQAGMAVKVITAKTKDDARAIAEVNAPGKEFVLTLHPQSDEQMLGQVRHQALSATQDCTPDLETDETDPTD